MPACASALAIRIGPGALESAFCTRVPFRRTGSLLSVREPPRPSRLEERGAGIGASVPALVGCQECSAKNARKAARGPLHIRFGYGLSNEYWGWF